MNPISKSFKVNISLYLGVLMLLLLVGASVFAPWLTPYDPFKVNMNEKIVPMSKNHPFGTDMWGRDIFSRILFGARYSLPIAVGSIGLSMLFGGLFGVIGGYYSNRKFASLIVWVTDIIMAFPTIILGAMVGVIFGPGMFNTVIALSIAYFPRFIRLARGATLAVKEEVYITAARSLGMSDFRLLYSHLVPNIVSPIIIMAIIWSSGAISLEVALSFLGLGVPPPIPSWGNILQDNLTIVQMEPLSVIWPCIAIAWAIQSFNLIGDRFRDILDPRMR